jgi:plastocyanin
MGKQTFDKKKTVTILLAIFFVATLTATSVSAKTVDVSIKGSAFNPQTAQISKGDFVSWMNKDTINHNVKSVSGPSLFDSGTIHPGQSYEFQFTNIGTVEYRDSTNPNMRGTVKVV